MSKPLLPAAFVTLLLLAACSSAVPPAPSASGSAGPSAATAAWQPKAGVCHTNLVSYLSAEAYLEVDCAQLHGFETVAVGKWQVEDWPANDSETWRKTWAECDSQVTAYLGGPWRERPLRLSVAAPERKAWEKGARWYLCEVTVMVATMSGPTSIKGSIKSRFTQLLTEMEGCVLAEAGGGVRSSTRCDAPHSLEFVAWIPTDLPYSIVEEPVLAAFGLCREHIAKFIGVPKVTRTLPEAVVPKQSSWDSGDHNVACYLNLDRKKISHSLRGAGKEVT